jgi:hypothetical protein
LSTSSEFIIYTGKQEVKQQFWRAGVDIVTGRTCDRYSLNINTLGKADMLHFALTPFCSWGCANSACRLLGIAVLMSSSHGFSYSISHNYLYLKK